MPLSSSNTEEKNRQLIFYVLQWTFLKQGCFQDRNKWQCTFWDRDETWDGINHMAYWHSWSFLLYQEQEILVQYFNSLASSTPRRETLKTQQSLVIFGQGNLLIIVSSSFSKSAFFLIFPVHMRTKKGVFKFLRSEDRFRKAPFLWRISVYGRPVAAFSNCSRVVLTEPFSSLYIKVSGKKFICFLCTTIHQWLGLTF